MKILIVSGFLGAGKTTFIKRKIERLVQDKQFLGNRLADSILESRGCRE